MCTPAAPDPSGPSTRPRRTARRASARAFAATPVCTGWEPLYRKAVSATNVVAVASSAGGATPVAEAPGAVGPTGDELPPLGGAGEGAVGGVGGGIGGAARGVGGGGAGRDAHR